MSINLMLLLTQGISSSWSIYDYVASLGILPLHLPSLLKDKILQSSRFKMYADVKINFTQKLRFVSGRVENTEGKGEK